MTEPLNESQNFSEDDEQLIARYQEMLMRQVGSAYEKGEMEPDVYMLFMSKVCEADTRDGIYDHFEIMFNELADYHEERLQARIIKGAEYIENIGPNHQKYKAALCRYNELCEQLQVQRERRRANARGGRNRERREQRLG